jgi:ribose transport system substrate-binding protein
MKSMLMAMAVPFALSIAPAVAFSADSPYANLDMAPTKSGPYTENIDMKEFCGTKKIRVALSDGYTANSWRKTAFAEFQDEAKKCPNITEVLHTDAQGNAQKQISDIESLAAQHVDVIIVFPDFGEALIKAMHDATAAGSVVVPYDTGTSFPGERLKDYLVAVTEDQKAKAVDEAKWAAEALGGKGNVLELGGIAGNPVTGMMNEGWGSVFKNYPGIKVLEGGPVFVNWDPAETQRVVSGLLAKYPQIDATMNDLGSGSVAALRSFEGVSRPLPLTVTEDVNELGCYYMDHHAASPTLNMITTSSGTWMVRRALRKGVAAAEGKSNTEASIVTMVKYEDSTSKDAALAPHCDKGFPPDTNFSSWLSRDALKALFK